MSIKCHHLEFYIGETLDIQEKRDKVIEEDLCDHCLGRQFAEIGHGLENYERGVILRDLEDIKEEDFSKENVPDDASIGGSCSLCNGVFNDIELYKDNIIDKLNPYEINTILIGTKPSNDIKKKEMNFWDNYGSSYAEPIKRELNRLLGKKVQGELDLRADFGRPDINAVLNLDKGVVELQVNSLLIYGQYNKYSREIPQTEWPCYECGGAGCEECNGTGKTYQESVQEVIQESFVDVSEADDAKFHGAGREDIDAKCFGKREFVLELLRPKKRNFEIKKIQNRVNKKQDKVEVFKMQKTSKDKIKDLKTKRAQKTYRALVDLSEEVKQKDLKKLNDLVGLIKQRTPSRVGHRRSNKVRERKVFRIDYDKVCKKKLELVIKAEAGTYIKEFISSDEGRTKPSIADILNSKAKCKKLDVLNIDK